MEQLLDQMIGQRVEVFCGAATLLGEVKQVRNGVLHLADEKHLNYIPVASISFLRKVSEERRQTGFIPDALTER